MSATVIRDVTIRVKLEQVQAELVLPNYTSAKAAAEDYNASIQQISTAVQEGFTKASAAVQKTIQDHAKAGEAARKAAKDESDAKKAAAQVAQQAAAAQATAAAAATKPQEDLTKKSLEAVDRLKQAGEGAFTFARGLTMLSTSTDDDFGKMLAAVAEVQGAFDLFKGSVEITKLLTIWLGSLRTASAAAAVGQTALAGANTAVTASSVAAAGGLTAMWAALGPLGWIVIAISAAITAAALAWRHYSDGVKKADEANATAKLKEQQQAAEKLHESILNVANAYKKTADQIQGMQSVRMATIDMMTSQFGVASDIQSADRSRLLQSEEQRMPGDLRKQMNSAVGYNWSFAADTHMAGGQNRQSTQSEMFSYLQGSRGNLGSMNTARLESTERLAETAKGFAEQDVKLQQEKLRVIREQGQELVKNLDTTRSALEMNRKAIEEEKKRLMGAEAKFGALNPLEQERLKQIGEKAGRGEKLSKEEALSLQESGFGEKLSTGRLSEIGREAGAGAFFKQIGENENLQKLQEDTKTLESQVNQLTDAIVRKRQEETRQVQRIITALEEATNMESFLKEVERMLDRRRQKARNM